jgi:hypothetical protein
MTAPISGAAVHHGVLIEAGFKPGISFSSSLSAAPL